MSNQLRVLVVDDDDLFRTAIARRLGTRMSLFVATSADETRIVVANEDLDAIVTDYDLGTGETGLDLLRGLRATHPQVRRILMTGGLPQGLYPEEGLCEAVLTKPFDARVLLDLLEPAP